VVSIAVASLQAGGVLAVGGSPGNDDLRFVPGASAGQIEVELNGVSLGNYSPTSQLLAFGQAGDDDVQVAGGINLPACLSGDAGHDRLREAAAMTCCSAATATTCSWVRADGICSSLATVPTALSAMPTTICSFPAC
jgi:hypothetical protein